MTGKIITHYRVLEKIGGGGMGMVYRGTDIRLQRQVALKFLHVTTDEEALARFRAEARTASALNHAHICTVYDIGDFEGAPFLVMELLDGRTLEQFLRERRPTLDELLEFAVQIADALEAAHAKGIVHRDIKPANIFITEKRQIKVLDFGLAKLSKVEALPEDGEIAIHHQTNEGSTVGTIAYMAPEQALGEDTDTRADLFSFGVVLYQMASGALPFKGSTPAAIFGALLNHDPEPVSASNPAIPPELGLLIEKALEKDRELRCQTAAEMKADLKRLMRNQLQPRAGSSGSHSLAAVPVARSSKLSRRTIVGTSMVAGAALGGYGLFRWGRSRRVSSEMRLRRLTTSGGIQLAALSPDGRFFASVFEEGGQQGLLSRLVSTASRSVLLAPSEFTYSGLTYSRDGDFLYFCRSANNEPAGLYRIPVLGGYAPQKIFSLVYHSISFSPDSQSIAFLRYVPASGKSLLFVGAADGRNEKQLAARQLPAYFEWPAWSPDDSSIACSVGAFSSGTHGTVVSIPRSGGAETVLTAKRWKQAHQLEWMPDGRGLVLAAEEDSNVSGDQLWFVSYPEGAARPLTHDLDSYAGVSISRDGHSLLTVQTTQTSGLRALTPEPHDLTSLSSRGDGINGVAWEKNGAVVYASKQNGPETLYRLEALGKSPRILTSGTRSSHSPRIALGTGDIVFVSNGTEGSHIWKMGVEGDSLEQLTTGTGETMPDISSDGKWLFYVSVPRLKSGVWRRKLPDGAPELVSKESSLSPAISPDGTKLAFLVHKGQQDWRIGVVLMAGGPMKTYGTSIATRRSLRWKGNDVVTYVEAVKGITNILGQTLSNAAPRSLISFAGGEKIFSFDWSSEGWLVCAQGNVDGDAVLATGL